MLWRPGGADGFEVALVHRARYDDWSLPKGKLRRGEHPLLAACREVYEETGERPVVGRQLPTQSYLLVPPSALACTPGFRDPVRRRAAVDSGPPGRSKSVRFWAMRAAGRRTRTLDDEVDAVGWLAPDAAEQRLSYDTDREVLRAFRLLPPDTVTLLLVRHAHAVHRAGWDGEDRLRPLDATGWRQAERLRQALLWFEPHRVLAADRTRCVQTVTPLATALGVGVEVDPRFGEDAYTAEVTRDVLRALAARGVSAVVCSQSGLIPELVEALSCEDTVALPVPPPESAPAQAGWPTARKGSTWALSFHRGRLVAADYYAEFR